MFNQYLPIQSTRNFENDLYNQVDQLMYTLLNYKQIINDNKKFYNNIGLQFSKEWIPIILKHKILFKPITNNDDDDDDNNSVLHRLVKELKIKSLTNLFIIFSSKFKIEECSYTNVFGIYKLSIKKTENIMKIIKMIVIILKNVHIN